MKFKELVKVFNTTVEGKKPRSIYWDIRTFKDGEFIDLYENLVKDRFDQSILEGEVMTIHDITVDETIYVNEWGEHPKYDLYIEVMINLK